MKSTNSIAEVLKDVKVLDLGVGMPAALVSKFLQELGATVIRVEPEGGDPGSTIYPAYAIWRRGQQQGQAGSIDKYLKDADVCILGGEDFPGLRRPRHAAQLAVQFPRLIALDISGYPPGSGYSDGPAVEILVQARSGLVWEHFTDRPLRFGFEACTYGAVLQSLTGLLAALIERERSGLGQVVATSLYEGALLYAVTFWSEAEQPTQHSSFVAPMNPYPLIFECADGDFIHLGLGSAGSKWQLYKLLGIDDPSVAKTDTGIPATTTDSKNFFGDIDLLARYIKPWRRDDLQKALDQAQVPAEMVLMPGECWDDPQVQLNGLIVADPDGGRHVGNPIIFDASAAPVGQKKAAGSKPIEGIRVADFGAFVAGPFASAILADLGAEVIKIESVGGDPSRVMFHSFNASNRGKRCLALDIKSPEGVMVTKKLTQWADVVNNNFRPGVSARFGLDGETLHRDRPDIIVLESPAYGMTGPKALKGGFDPIMQAFTGHEHRAGGIGNPPLWNRGFMADFSGGQIGAIAVLAALYHRERTGAGATVGVALMNSGVYLLSELIQRSDGSFVGAAPLNAGRTGFHPAEALYQASDGWIAIAIRDDAGAKRLSEVLGLSGSLSGARAQWGEHEEKLIAQKIKARSLQENLAALRAAKLWAEECRRDGRAAALQNPDLLAAGTISDTNYAKLGRVKAVGPLVRFSRSKSGVSLPAPSCGQHSRELLAELGVDAATIDAMIERKAAL